MDNLVENLHAVAGREQVLSEPSELLVYECDGLTHYRARPRAVVFPRSTEETAEVVRVLARAGVPFAPRGAGTGLSGGALAMSNGVVIELARMRRVLRVEPQDRLAVVETGLVNAQLSRAVAPHKLHYAPDPSSQTTCTIGGNIAENAGGIHCLKYGVTVDHVLSARVVLSDGEVVDLPSGEGGASGYDLLGLFVGSEGTFGIATEATVRLTPSAPAVRTLLADFSEVDDASRAVSAIIAEGLIPAALEMVDGATIRAVEASVFAAGLPLDAEAALLIELDGLEAGLDEEAGRCESICRQHGARTVRRAADEAERRRLWAARKGAFGAMGRISPDLLLQDAVVPRSRLPEVLAATYRIGASYGLRVANVFHAGDGNLHPYICFDARDAREVERVHEASREIMETCVRAGGTITGEHGVGLDKAAYLPLIFSPEDLDAMLRVRAAFDPSGLCNPGKILPAPRGCGEARAVASTRRHGETETQRDGDAATRRRGDTATQREDFGARGQDDATTQRRVEERIGDRDPQVEESPDVASPDVALSPHRLVHESRRRRVAASPCLALGAIVGEAHTSVVSFAGGREAVAVAPASEEEACEVLRLASSEGWGVVPAGAATWLEVGQPLARADVVLKTSRLTSIKEHEPADLVVTAETGLTLDALNRVLVDAGQWLPLDPPDDGRATLGGVAATGLSGAQSYGYGSPRGFVTGVRVALADGRVIKAGGRVAKNVAGYDLCKLFVGSYGTLGLILETTFKLRPRPAREATLVALAAQPAPLFERARALLDAQLLPVAVELLSPGMTRTLGLATTATTGTTETPYALLVRFAGAEQRVAYQLARAQDIFEHSRAGIDSVAAHNDDAAIWRTLAAAPLRQPEGLAWRARVRPTQLAALLAEATSGEGAHDGSLWHAGLGDGRLRFIETGALRDESTRLPALEKLRRMACADGGSFVLESAAPELKRALGAWGLPRPAARLMRRIKDGLDEHNLFSPGRFDEVGSQESGVRSQNEDKRTASDA